jgi:hypothetical protein
LWFVCKYCHTHKIIDGGRGGIVEVTKATLSAATHLGLPKASHNLTKDGLKTILTAAKLLHGQLSLRRFIAASRDVQQDTANQTCQQASFLIDLIDS